MPWEDACSVLFVVCNQFSACVITSMGGHCVGVVLCCVVALYGLCCVVRLCGAPCPLIMQTLPLLKSNTCLHRF